MANIKITDLPELTTTPNDANLLEIVDKASETPTSKKITWANIKAAVLTAVGKVNGAVGFTLSGGTTSKTLTVEDTMTLKGYATAAEITTGTEAAKAIAPDQLALSKYNKDYSCPNNTEKIQYPLPTSAYMLKAGSDGEPVVGTNTDTDVADAVSKKHTQHTDTGTTATSFKINTGGSEADLQTTGLTADRDFTFPDIDTMLAGSVLLAQNTCEIIECTP